MTERTAMALAGALCVALAACRRPAPAADQAAVARADVQAGERIYRRGLRPAGGPIPAVIKADVVVDSTVVTCASCHLRSGFGSTEGRLLTPPTTGEVLFQPAPTLYKGVPVTSAPPRRPAYTEQTLARLLRSGVDATGRKVEGAMPRYQLGDAEVAQLAAYLRTLSAEASPGITGDTIHLATVVTDDAPAAEREAMAFVLDKYVALKNTQAQQNAAGSDLRSARMAERMLGSRETAYKRLELSTWVLSGPPGTYRAQLLAHYRKQPVFALVSGMAPRGWAEIHAFSEAERVPCLFPVTDLPVVGDGDYTMYLSRGYQQEGEGAARYLAGLGGDPAARVVEVVRATPEGEALAAGFDEARRAAGQPPAVRMALAPGAAAQGALAAIGDATVVVVWDGAEGLPLVEALAKGGHPPASVLLSASYLGEALFALGEAARPRTFIAYPYRLPEEEQAYRAVIEPWLLPGLAAPTASDGGPAPAARSPVDRAYRSASAAYAASVLLTQALMEMRGRYHRDYFVDVIGMARDLELPTFPRLSFGIGQRYMSKGCYIVQLTSGPHPALVRRSDWLTH